jgi:hypothetical protein
VAGPLNLVKLCVGADSVADLADWQAQPRAQGPDGLPRHVTRMWPRRADELLAGGSLYWVIAGAITVRQRIARLDRVIRDDGIARCGIVLDPALVRTRAAPRRPFQGWRYLAGDHAPADLANGPAEAPALPDSLARALAEIGVL